ncbi:MAG: glycosyltransferase, partial [Janthinobacterium lividum]
MHTIVETTTTFPSVAQQTNHGRLLYIILSFNGCSDTIDCLDSLYADLPKQADLLLIDNASSGDVVSQLRGKFPQLEIIALPENLGWAGGNNVGVRLGLQRGYDWICLLNNDTVFPEHAAR